MCQRLGRSLHSIYLSKECVDNPDAEIVVDLKKKKKQKNLVDNHPDDICKRLMIYEASTTEIAVLS